MSTAAPISPSDFALLCEVIDTVARASRLPREDAEDFAQTVHLKLLERSYAPLARFSGRSSLRTFLTVVVQRLLLDWRNSRYGKWRPSTCARRLGPLAIALDRLMSRDGHPLEIAIEILAARTNAAGAGVLRALAAQLPHHSRPRTIVTDDLESLAVQSFDDPIDAEQAALATRRRLVALARAFRRLPAADRRLLTLRFARRMTIASIAAHLKTPAKPLYRRVARLLATLRQEMQPFVPLGSADAFGTPMPPLDA